MCINLDTVASVSNVVVAAAAVWVTWHSSSESNKINRRMLRNSLFDKKKAIRDALIDMVQTRPVRGSDFMQEAYQKAAQATADLSLLTSDERAIELRSLLLANYSAAIDARNDWEEARDIEKALESEAAVGHISIEDHEEAIKDTKKKRRTMDARYKACQDALVPLIDYMNQDIRLYVDK
jgi:hypothetical protein